jgi:DNA mismatch repair protein MutS
VVAVVDKITFQETTPLTPMMRQYREAKDRHPDCILLFRMGDFYEMFFEDARRASTILDIALTTRDKNKPEKIPMCGFPHHSSSGYISRLLAAGERVAICDQVEDPRDAKGIVRREITRVLTPGLTEEPGTLKIDENHFLVAVSCNRTAAALASFDLSTGDFKVTETGDFQLAAQELRRLDPKEVIIPDKMVDSPDLEGIIDESMNVHGVDDWLSDPDNCVESLRELYGVQNLDGFGLSDDSLLAVAAGMVVGYLKQTRPDRPSHIKTLRVYHLGNYMILDQSTIRNLEIFRNTKDGSSDGTLVQLLGKTTTPMGARLLRQWLSYPLLDISEIQLRLEVVEILVNDLILHEQITGSLKSIGDLERIAGKIALKNVTPRDLVQLKESAQKLPELIQALRNIETELGERLGRMDDLSYVAVAIDAVLVDSPPLNFREGGIIKEGYHEELDELRSIRKSGKEWIARVESGEREKTGIPTLKVGYNKVFGYYIEVTKAQQDKIPGHYIRKQTLVNAERYVTEDLKEYELKILNAQDRIIDLENEIFNLLRVRLLEVIPRIQDTAYSVACLDVLTALAEVASKKNYVRPRLQDSQHIEIIEGRHPVLEDSTRLEAFVPNNTTLDVTSQQILIITGPNMAGKSTYMRQVALIVLMAQIGSFVPASEAAIGIVDRIFTRIGAADYLAFGQSTFMVEMNETAQILHNATNKSLVLLDEIGRGTSTFDGLSIAWAVTEFLHDIPGGGPRTLFATHYHELVDVALVKSRAKNFTIAVREWKDRIIFLRKIVPGGTSRSYGIQVARLAGIPEEVVERAKEILSSLEKKEIETSGFPSPAHTRDSHKGTDRGPYQAELFRSHAEDLLEALDKVEIETVTPLAALNLLSDWKDKYTRTAPRRKNKSL